MNLRPPDIVLFPIISMLEWQSGHFRDAMRIWNPQGLFLDALKGKAYRINFTEQYRDENVVLFMELDFNFTFLHKVIFDHRILGVAALMSTAVLNDPDFNYTSLVPTFFSVRALAPAIPLFDENGDEAAIRNLSWFLWWPYPYFSQVTRFVFNKEDYYA